MGALGLPDIGQLFPDNDPTWKNADSSIFMEEAYKRMTEMGYKIGNVDVTLILQSPKVKDFKPAMRQNIIRLLRANEDRVNIKARTHEKVNLLLRISLSVYYTSHLQVSNMCICVTIVQVDSIGESRSYACHVVVLLEKDTSKVSALV